MKILICGASGFIGEALCISFAQAGHSVVRAVRRATLPGDIVIDYAKDIAEEDWADRVRGIDVVVNAVGIIVEQTNLHFDDIHRRAPEALFNACVRAGVKRVVQISALGADRGNSRYFRSKRAADEFLMSLPIDWQILRPALVYGENGESAKLFKILASLPVQLLPAGGGQALQPIHIDDLTSATLQLAHFATSPGQCVDLVGPSPVTYREMLACYRSAMGFPNAWRIPVPKLVMTIAAECAGHLPGALLNRETWQMLQEGNVGDPAHTAQILGRQPRALQDFIPPESAPDVRNRALAAWRNPLLRGALAAIWLMTALVSAVVFPISGSLDLLSKVGLSGMPALFALYGAVTLDLLMGVACIRFPGRRLWLFQIAVILAYTLIIACALPEFLWHPFGPILKNITIIAVLFILLAEEVNP